MVFSVVYKKGIIYRDIKFYNIFILNEGRVVKVVDFGIVKVVLNLIMINIGSIIGLVYYFLLE